ncbi:MAG: ribonuclease Z [Oscillospiraceae bacterium]|nr:ribonuclease Z [Oscillospiraceae bacterium]
MLDVCLLGTGGMMPLPGRWLTSLLFRYNGKMFLIDCGEGTQIPLKQAGWGFKAVDAIFFTHYHADHIAGLPGLLLTIGNSGKDTPLDLIGPPGLLWVVRSLLAICPALPYEIRAVEMPSQGSGSASNSGAGAGSDMPPHADIELYGNLSFQYAQCDHNATCYAYSFHLRRQGAFKPERAKALDVPLGAWKILQSGEPVSLPDGRRIEPDMVLGPARRGIKLCYCTDTRPAPSLRKLFSDADLLICEGMYGSDTEIGNARQKKHMTFGEAATLARDAGAGELWLTHYSPSLQNPSEHLGAARRIFEKTYAGRDLMSKTLKFAD